MSHKKTTVGIVGLGLIGGSFAKALAGQEQYRVLAADRDSLTLGYAKMAGAVHGDLTRENLPECDYVILVVYPAGAEQWLQDNAPYCKKGGVVMDAVGIKRHICQLGNALAEEYGFHFVGGHPMAGTQFSGFKYARESLFHNATMILCPKKDEDLHILNAVKALMLDCGFANLNITDPDTHDQRIAYTSQLAHVVSSAYVKSPEALRHRRFSAGSYRDLTRVARLNEDMWSELFLDNRDYLLQELEELQKHLEEYRQALAAGDRDTLHALLKEGREIKERTLSGEKSTG